MEHFELQGNGASEEGGNVTWDRIIDAKKA